MTARDGRVSKLEQVFLRGGQIKFIVLPDLLKNAPIFKKVQVMKAKTASSETVAKGSKNKAPKKREGPI
jgi:small nuclear ribonucleoprotein D3